MSRVALIQLSSTASVDQNLESMILWFEKAASHDVDLLVLPENFAFMGLNEQDKLVIAEEPFDGKIQHVVSQLAKHYGVWTIAGTIPLRGLNGRVRASSIVFDALGHQVACYDKIHLFDVNLPDGECHQESRTVQPGHTITVVDTPIGCVGLSVCYDVRFPELYRAMVLKGAEIFTIPAAFTAVTGAAHWETLLRARAIENLAYVLAPNQCGEHENGRNTYGHSMIINPWGQIIGQAQNHPDFVIAEIELSYLRTLRQQFPCNEHHIMA
jgi:nitrilase